MTKKRPAKSKQSLERSAIAFLLEYRAIRECPDHGHMRDNTDTGALRNAYTAAKSHPFPGTTPEQSVAAIDEAMRWIGDTCPECAYIKRNSLF